MPVNLTAPEVLHPVRGVRVGTTSLGQRKEPRHDLTVFHLAEGASVAATFTRSTMCAAPVTLAKEHLTATSPRALVVNAGNANACSGPAGMEAARRTCADLGALLDVPAAAVLPFSTGVIGEPLDADVMAAAFPAAVAALREDGWMDASQAILTTDIVAKGSTRRIILDGRECTITGIAKGSGMIHPDMATMLSYVATDASVTPQCLDEMLREAVSRSFNRVTVDGDTSTNDAVVLVATGASGAAVIDGAAHPDHAMLSQAVLEVCTELAHAVVRDGEGATKFVTITVEEGRDAAECRQVAFTIAHSPLVKTALFASDANWGRICMAVGRAGVEDLAPERVRIWLDEVQIVDAGGRAADYTEARGAAVMAREEITIRVALGRGEARDTVWTCDFSHQYVTINADYRS